MSLTSGSKLGPYEILAPLGAGGMGEVYRARDKRLQRDVAIKVLPVSFAEDPDRLRRFEQEARATAALNHPNILAVFDLGTHDGAPYVVGELLEGETLRDRLRGGPLPVRKTMDYALQIAHGLAAAHEKGIIHRDLKPENLFITRDGRAKILDFGLAKLTQPDRSAPQSVLVTESSVTNPGVVLGTMGYMSPEQVRGVALDPRSDLFSFGAILYEMLTGKRAFHGATAADTMSAILKEDPPEMAEIDLKIPSTLERIVRRCLEKQPEQRFHSASDLAFAIEALSGTSTHSAAIAQPTSIVNRKYLPAIAGATLMAVALVAGWWLGSRRDALPAPTYSQITFRLGDIGNARFTPDGSVVYSASWDGGPVQLYIAQPDNPGARELGIQNADILSISRSGEMAIRMNTIQMSGNSRRGTLAELSLGGGTPREILENVQDADWAPNGTDMAVVRYVPETAHWRLEYPIGKVLFDTTNWISHPKISADGKTIAFSDHLNPNGDDQGTVAVIGADGKEKILSTGWTSLQGILWSPKGDEIWFTASDSGSAMNPRAVTLSGKVRIITSAPDGMLLQDWRDGKALIVARRTRLNLRGMGPGAKQEQELGWFGWSYLDGLSPDGKKVLFEEQAEGGGPNYSIFLRSTDGSPPVRLGEGSGMAISPDGQWVAAQPSTGGHLRLVPTGAGEPRELTHDNVSYFPVRWMPNGKQLMAVGIEQGHSARDYLIDTASGDSRPATPEGVRGVNVSPDGQRVAVLTANSTWEIWPLAGGQPTPIPTMTGEENVVGWMDDGKTIFVAAPHPRTGVPGIYRLSLATGARALWKTNSQAGTAGVSGIGRWIVVNNGQAYSYNYARALAQAYIVTGLR